MKKQKGIPTTISKEAQKMLLNWTIEGRDTGANLPKWDAPINVWEQKQKEFEAEASKPLSNIIEIYKPTIKTIFLGDIRAIEVTPKEYQKSDKVIIYIHGGGFVFYPADVTLLSSIPLADVSGLKIITIDYTLAPQAKYDQILNEVIKAYKYLLEEYQAENIAIYGDSAGGSITAGAILKMRDLQIDLPCVVVLWSAWLDLEETGDSYFTLKNTDPNLVYNGFLENCAEAYAPKREWKNPYISPVYGDYSKDFPPTLIQVGSKEIFLSNSIRMYRQLKENNKEVELDIYEGMWHVWQGNYEIPESKVAIKNTKNFILKHLGKSK
jgi:acetyl esterase/lipase